MPEITDWTSAGINWEKPQLASLYDALESIRLALLERMSVTGIDYDNLSPIMKDIRMKNTYDVMSEFHSNISSAITNFAKHTDNNGNWNNQDAIPFWTEESILEEIGDTERVQVSRLGFMADWIIQSYKILNLLKWARFKFSILNTQYEKKYPENGFFIEKPWSEMISNFKNLNWINYGLSYTATYLAQTAGGNLFKISSARSRGKIPLSKYHQCTKDFYYYAYSINGQTINNISFSDFLNGYKYTLFKTENEGAGNEDGEYYIFSDEDFNNTNFIEPKIDELPPQVALISSESLVVSKYDGSNGFKFLETE